MRSLTLALVLLVSSMCWAQSNDEWSPEKIGTVSSGTAATGFAGYKSFSNFQAAKNIVEKNTQIIINTGENAKFFSTTEVDAKTATITNGDDVKIQYHLSEKANRQWWVDDYRSGASSARSSASYHQTMSLTATKAHYINVSDGKGGTRRQYAGQRPDYSARAYHALQASSESERAIRLDRRADEIAAGAPVEWKKFTKEFSKEATTKTAVKNAMNDIMTKNGGKVYSLTRLPKLFANEARKRGVVGWVFTGFAVLTGAGTVYEAVTGELAGTIESELTKGSFELNFEENDANENAAYRE